MVKNFFYFSQNVKNVQKTLKKKPKNSFVLLIKPSRCKNVRKIIRLPNSPK